MNAYHLNLWFVCSTYVVKWSFKKERSVLCIVAGLGLWDEELRHQEGTWELRRIERSQLRCFDHLTRMPPSEGFSGQSQDTLEGLDLPEGAGKCSQWEVGLGQPAGPAPTPTGPPHEWRKMDAWDLKSPRPHSSFAFVGVMVLFQMWVIS